MALSDTNRQQSSNFVELVGDNENDKSTESGLTNARVEPKETYPNLNPSKSSVGRFDLLYNWDIELIFLHLFSKIFKLLLL